MLSTVIVVYPWEQYLPMHAEDGYCLHYQQDGQTRGGVQGCPSPAPPIEGVPTQLLMVDTSAAVNAALKAGYFPGAIWIEDIAEVPSGEAL